MDQQQVLRHFDPLAPEMGEPEHLQASLACLQRLETGIRGYSPSDLLMPAVDAGVPQQPSRQPRH